MVDLLKRLMEANRTTGSQITTGDTRPGRTHWVATRTGKPCRRCGTPIRKADQPSYDGERVTTGATTCHRGWTGSGYKGVYSAVDGVCQ
jgi:endonuclease-8